MGRGRDSVKFTYRHIYVAKAPRRSEWQGAQRNEFVPYELAHMAYFSVATCRVISARRGPSVYQSRTIHASTHAGDVVGGPVRDKCLRRGLARWRADSSVMETGG